MSTQDQVPVVRSRLLGAGITPRREGRSLRGAHTWQSRSDMIMSLFFRVRAANPGSGKSLRPSGEAWLLLIAEGGGARAMSPPGSLTGSLGSTCPAQGPDLPAL